MAVGHPSPHKLFQVGWPCLCLVSSNFMISCRNCRGLINDWVAPIKERSERVATEGESRKSERDGRAWRSPIVGDVDQYFCRKRRKTSYVRAANCVFADQPVPTGFLQLL